MASLYGALKTASSSLNGQSAAISIIADNITNSNTVGYKAGDASFSTLVTNSANSSSYSSGGVNIVNKISIEQQGVIQETNSGSDIAISGKGFFVVNTKSDGTGSVLLTRAGSFVTDNTGNYVNTAGYTLFGWPLDSSGRLPGATGNINSTSSSLIASLQPVNVNAISSSANPTTAVKLGINLMSTEKVIKGSGETITIPSSSVANYGISTKSIIAYEDAGSNIFNYGDGITLTPSDTGISTNYTYGGFWMSSDITSDILGATNANVNFTSATAGDNFSITTPDGGTVNFAYKPISPIASKGEFNNLATLADAINTMSGMSARVDSSGKYLYFGPINATQAWSMTDNTGTFVSALFNGAGGPPATVSIAAGSNRFSSLQGLTDLINQTSSLGAAFKDSSNNSSLNFYTTDPLGTLSIAAYGGSSSGVGGPTGTPVTPLANPGTSTATSILTTLGLSTTSPYVTKPAYDPTGAVGPNMASGKVGSNFNSAIQVYDSLGAQHDFIISFLKTANNVWAVEVYDAKTSDIITSSTNGQIAYGNLEFNGDGSLKSISNSLTGAIPVSWTNGANQSNITFNFGNAGQESGTLNATSVGLTNGLSQLAGDYKKNFITQDGNVSGTVSSVSFDANGYVIANFTNGTSRNIFQLPVANVSNTDGLLVVSGNAFSSTISSGPINLLTANVAGSGQVQSSSLEQSNVNLSNELTNMIVAQKGYQASAKVMKASSEMLDTLDRTF